MQNLEYPIFAKFCAHSPKSFGNVQENREPGSAKNINQLQVLILRQATVRQTEANSNKIQLHYEINEDYYHILHFWTSENKLLRMKLYKLVTFSGQIPRQILNYI